MEPFTWSSPSAPHSIAFFSRLICCTCTKLAAETSLQLPSGSGFWLVGVIEGMLSTALESHPLHITSGAAIGFPTDAPLSLTAEKPTTLLAALLSGQAVTQILGSTLAYSPYFPNGSSALSGQLFPLLHLAQSGHAPDGAASSAAAFTLLTQLAETSTPPETAQPYPPLIQHAIAIMHEDFAHLYGIDDLAERLEVSPSHLIRKFSATVGMSPGQYLTQIRIHYAKRLLRSGSVSLELVAAGTGFSNASYFGKVFRRITGMSPSAYIRSAPPLPLSDLPEMYL